MNPRPTIDFDNLAVAGSQNPYAHVNEIRERCPVGYTEANDGFWLLTRYDDVVAAARNPEALTNTLGTTIPNQGFPYPLAPEDVDPPLHRYFRAPLQKPSTKHAVAPLEPVLRKATSELIDGFVADGTADISQRLLIPISMLTMGEFLSLEPDLEAWNRWAKGFIGLNPDTGVIPEVLAFFEGLYDDRTSAPRDDLPTNLLGTRIKDRPITREEWIGTICAMFLAGIDTTANALGHIVLLLADRPDLRRMLVADPAIVPNAIEELLRYLSPAPSHSRTLTTDLEVGGVLMPAGDRVMLSWMAANRDPTHFQEPDEIRFDRKKNRHIAFGEGPHVCVGAHLARLGIRVVLTELLARIPDFEIGEGVVLYPGITRGVEHLPITWTPTNDSIPTPADTASGSST